MSAILTSSPGRENSTTVRVEMTASSLMPAEMSKRGYLTRAALLRLPFFNRAERAADLFCTPPPGTRARSMNLAAPEFARRTISADGITYQAYVLGEPSTQPYILCAHGWGSFGLRFAPWARAVAAAGFALVSFDHSAHGRSSGHLATFPSFVAGINAMRSAFGEPAAGVGHSFGGAAMAMAAAENALHCPLVLIAPPADLMVAIRYFVGRIKLPPRFANDIAAVLSARVGRDVRAFAAKTSTVNLHQRILVVHDVADAEVSWGAGLQYAMLAPNARMLSTTGLGHHRVLNDAETIRASLAHVLGHAVGEKLLVSNADLQDALA